VTAEPAATAALGPDPITGSGPGATADDTEIISWADFRAWERQLASTGPSVRRDAFQAMAQARDDTRLRRNDSAGRTRIRPAD